MDSLYCAAILDGWCRRPGLLEPKTEGSHLFYCASCTRSYWPIVFHKTELVLAGVSKAQMFENIKSSFDKKDLPTMELGSMCYMMSRDRYLSDANGHWHPHLMFFLPQTSDMAWGAGLPGSPVLMGPDPYDHLTVFLIFVGKWPNGSAERQTITPSATPTSIRGELKRF
jgi:hypothetical protein